MVAACDPPAAGPESAAGLAADAAGMLLAAAVFPESAFESRFPLPTRCAPDFDPLPGWLLVAGVTGLELLLSLLPVVLPPVGLVSPPDEAVVPDGLSPGCWHCHETPGGVQDPSSCDRH